MHNKNNSQQSLSDFFSGSNIFKFDQPGISSLELKFLFKTLSENINISGIKKIYNYNKAKLIKNVPVLHDKNFIKRNPNYNKQAM
jgi:predicted transcriptional regulator